MVRPHLKRIRSCNPSSLPSPPSNAPARLTSTPTLARGFVAIPAHIDASTPRSPSPSSCRLLRFRSPAHPWPQSHAPAFVTPVGDMARQYKHSYALSGYNARRQEHMQIALGHIFHLQNFNACFACSAIFIPNWFQNLFLHIVYFLLHLGGFGLSVGD